MTRLIQENPQENFLLSWARGGITILGLFLLAIAISRIIYPFDTGHIEAFARVPAEHLLDGQSPYSFATSPPYSMAPYGVVYYALVAMGVKIFGPQMWFARIFSVIAFAICAWVVSRIAGKLSGSTVAAYAACLAAVALFPGQAWIAIMRPDLIALAFALTAVCLVFEFEENEHLGPGHLGFIVLLSLAAVFTKHTFLLAVGVIVLRLVQLRRWREAAVYVTASATLAAFGVVLLNYSSAGGYVWQHFIHARSLPFTLSHLQTGVTDALASASSIVLIVACLIFILKKGDELAQVDRAEIRSYLRSPKVLIVFYFLASFAMATFSAGRVGANINYFLETSFVGAIVFGLIVLELARRRIDKTALAMVVLMTISGAFQMVRVARGEYFRWQSRSYYEEISASAGRYISEGDICVSVYSELVSRNGCQVYFDDYGEYVGGWSPELTSIFRREVSQGRFAVIIWSTDDLDSEFPNYKLVQMSQNTPQRFFPVYLYVPQTEPDK